MEQNKIDKRIKQQFDERTIIPSENAWERIDKILHEENRKSSKRLRYWVAASVVVLVLLSVAFFSGQKQNEGPIKIVKDKVVVPENKKENIENQPTENLPIKKEEIVIAVKKESIIQTDKHINDHVVKQLPKIKDKVNTNSIAIVDTAKQPIDFEEQKALEVATKINALQQQGTITDAEIEALLLQAQKEIKAQRAIENNTRVDAMALLLDVEDELDKPFKEKVLEMLKKGLGKAKTVVAERD